MEFARKYKTALVGLGLGLVGLTTYGYEAPLDKCASNNYHIYNPGGPGDGPTNGVFGQNIGMHAGGGNVYLRVKRCGSGFTEPISRYSAAALIRSILPSVQETERMTIDMPAEFLNPVETEEN